MAGSGDRMVQQERRRAGSALQTLQVRDIGIACAPDMITVGHTARSEQPPEDLSMSSRKLDELASDVDDAAEVVEELQVEPDVDASEKLSELKETLEDASDRLDELHDEDDD